MVSCRYCKGDHWTLKCPYKDTLLRTEEAGKCPWLARLFDDGCCRKEGVAAHSSSLSLQQLQEGVGEGVGTSMSLQTRETGVTEVGQRENQCKTPDCKVGLFQPVAAQLDGLCGLPDDQATVRVTNLSEEAQEGDLRDLFSHFGNLKRIFLAKDKHTQQSKVCYCHVSNHAILLT